MTETRQAVFDDADALARAAAGELVLRLIGIQATRGRASVVLTGGGIGTAVLGAVATDPDVGRVRWPEVSLWWGDERYLPTGDPERNDTAARPALLDRVDLDPSRVHPMPARPESGPGDPQAAAAAYAAELAGAAAEDPGPVPGLPQFDVLLLGVGPEGHVASLFPADTGAAPVPAAPGVAAALECPKPPSARITLTMGALNSADEVWLLAAGASKAGAVAAAFRDPGATPAGRVRGTRLTRWWLDREAAAG